MSFLKGYLLLFLVLSPSIYFNISPTVTWVLGLVILFITIKKKNPFDPQAWMFFSWGILFVNTFSGVTYIPYKISFLQPITYIILIISMFHAGFYFGRSKGYKYNFNQLRTFLTGFENKSRQNLISFLGIASFIGSIMVAFDMFILQGMSMDGGDRRAQFLEFNFTALTTTGMTLLGGSFISGLSLFFRGNKTNKFIGILSLFSIALSSIAIAGKQGILLAILIVLFSYFTIRFLKLEIKIPLYLKLSLFFIIGLFIIYTTSLSSERNGGVDNGELFTQSTRLNQSFKDEMFFVPTTIQNTFAEFFNYYGDQLSTFSERWELDNYLEKYDFIAFPPRVLGPFVWLERQIQKFIPFYNSIFEINNIFTMVNSQNNGYFSLANWQTTIKHGMSLFGYGGLMIVVFFHGYFSRRLYENVGRNATLININMSLLNNIFMVYTIMMNLLGETSAFFYLVILIILYLRDQQLKNEVIRRINHKRL